MKEIIRNYSPGLREGEKELLDLIAELIVEIIIKETGEDDYLNNVKPVRCSNPVLFDCKK